MRSIFYFIDINFMASNSVLILLIVIESISTFIINLDNIQGLNDLTNYFSGFIND